MVCWSLNPSKIWELTSSGVTSGRSALKVKANRFFKSLGFVLEVAAIQGPVVQIRGLGKDDLLPM